MCSAECDDRGFVIGKAERSRYSSNMLCCVCACAYLHAFPVRVGAALGDEGLAVAAVEARGGLVRRQVGQMKLREGGV